MAGGRKIAFIHIFSFKVNLTQNGNESMVIGIQFYYANDYCEFVRGHRKKIIKDGS